MLVDGDHPHWWIDPATLPVADIGDFDIALGDIPNSLALIQAQAARMQPSHRARRRSSISLPLLRALASRQGAPLALVHFDAHVDTWPDNFGQVYRAWLGILSRHRGRTDRSAPHGADRHPLAGAEGCLRLDDRQGRDDRHRAGRARDRTAGGRRARDARLSATHRPISPSISIVSIRPSRPAPAHRRSAGSRAGRRRRSCAVSTSLHFIGMDVVEVAPAYDTAEITALAAATMVWEYLALVGRQTN